ncbi:hypothetical protein GCM10027066_24920 [Dyella jejuensis]
MIQKKFFAKVRNLHPGVLAFPDVVRRIADAKLAVGFGELRPRFDFFEDADDVFFAELDFFMQSSFGETPLLYGSNQRGRFT